MTGKSGTGVSPVSFACDAARNMTRCWGSGFTNQYFYDHARRLIQIVSTNATGGHSTRFVYEGMDVIAKLDETTGEMVYFTRGLGIAPGVGDVLAETHILGSLTQTYIYVQNHRGDTIALVSNSTVVARYEYGAWGNVVSHTGPDAWLTFSGKHFDTEAGLYYYGYRWYDPQAKRWTQPDPSGLVEGLDLYQFCANNPINNVDVYGMNIWDLRNQLQREAEGRQALKQAIGLHTGYGWVDAVGNFAVSRAVDGLLDPYGVDTYTLKALNRYHANVCELGNNPWWGAIDAANLALGDMVGYTALLEARYGVDRETFDQLGTGERWVRGTVGGVQIVFSVFAGARVLNDFRGTAIGAQIERWFMNGAEHDVEFRQLTPLKQFFHEIGSRTYSDAEYESARQLSGSVNSYVREGMRTFIRENRSYIRTVWPRPAGLQLGIGTKAFGKGLTPAGRLYLGKAAVAGTMGIWTYDIYHITTVRLTIRETDVSG